MSAGHLSREFRRAYVESPYGYLMMRRIERAMALLRRGDPQRHRGLFRGRLGVAGQLQQSLHRAGRCAAQRLPAPRGARDGGHVVVRGETGDPTDQESRSAGHGAAPSVTAWTSPFTRASSRITIRTPPWPFTAAPWASRSALTSDTAGCAGSRSAPPTSPARPSSCRSRPSRITGFATAPFAIPWET